MKVGVIGCGFFAQNHLHAWRDIDDVDVVALCDNDQLNLLETGKEFEIERQFTDAVDLFDYGEFDIVDIATTAPSHRSLVEMAAQNTKHIICQKPFAESITDLSLIHI